MSLDVEKRDEKRMMKICSRNVKIESTVPVHCDVANTMVPFYSRHERSEVGCNAKCRLVWWRGVGRGEKMVHG